MTPLGNLNLVLFFGIGVIVLIAMGVPIAFSFGIATLLFFVLTTDLPLSVIVGRINEGMSHFILLTIPLFIFLGLQIQYTGMAKSMVDFFVAIFGGVRGGLGYVLLSAMYLVSGISGAKAADMAAIGPILTPAMKERGTREGDTAALLAVSAAAAETIPPSLVLIIIGSVTGISIAALFTGGLMPGVVCMLALAVAVYFRSRVERRGSGEFELRRVGRAFLIALPALVLPFIIRAAVLQGVATATEVAVIGILYVLRRRRDHDARRLVSPHGRDAGRDHRNVRRRDDHHRTCGRDVVGADSVRLCADAGAVHDASARRQGRLLCGVDFDVRDPRQHPRRHTGDRAIRAAVDFPPRRRSACIRCTIRWWFCSRWGSGCFSPPFGYGYYTACAIAKVSPDDAMWNMVPYLAALAVAILIVAAVPWFSIGLL